MRHGKKKLSSKLLHHISEHRKMTRKCYLLGVLLGDMRKFGRAQLRHKDAANDQATIEALCVMCDAGIRELKP